MRALSELAGSRLLLRLRSAAVAFNNVALRQKEPHAIAAIDGSKFQAVNRRDSNLTPGKIDARQRQIEQSIQRYLDALETADSKQPEEVDAKTERLAQKIKKLREQMTQLDRTKEELKKEPDGQRSFTDPDVVR